MEMISLKEPGIYNDKIEEGRNPINKENGGVFPEIKHNQESYIKISENEKQEEEKEKIQELEEKNKKQKKQRDKYKEYSKLILHIRAAITKYWKNLIKKKIRKRRNINLFIDYELFNEKSECQKVLSEFNMSMRDILNFHRESKKKPNKNQENIKKLETIYSDTHTKYIKEILDLIDLTYREVVELFFDNADSKEFRALTEKDKNKKINQNYIDRYGDSLFDKGGFFRYFERIMKCSNKREKK